jgi:hypothetical protein
MINNIKKILNNIFTYFLILLGLLILIWFIWIRFIRVRLPKDIPFNLNELSFYVLLWICVIYLYIVIRLIKPKNPHPWVTKVVEILYTPLLTLDNFIKMQRNVFTPYRKLLIKFIDYLNELSVHQFIVIYTLSQIIPRLILVSILSFDVFYMHKINIFYSFILLGAIPLLHRYIKYSLKDGKSKLLKILTDKYKRVHLCDRNKVYEEDWEYYPEYMPYHDKYLTIEEYYQFLVEDTVNFKENKIVYIADVYSPESVYNQYAFDKYGTLNVELTSEDSKNIRKDFHLIMPYLVDLTINLNFYEKIDEIFWIKYLRIGIFTEYFLCWSHILMVSYEKVELFPITGYVIFNTLDYIIPAIGEYIVLLITEYAPHIEPISGLIL